MDVAPWCYKWDWMDGSPGGVKYRAPSVLIIRKLALKWEKNASFNCLTMWGKHQLYHSHNCVLSWASFNTRTLLIAKLNQQMEYSVLLIALCQLNICFEIETKLSMDGRNGTCLPIHEVLAV